VLEAPEVNRIVSERFKLVFVDLDAPENGEKLIQFGIDANPTILVLREDGSVLSRSDGSMSKKQFLDVLNKINPAGQTAGGTDDRAAVELTRRAVFDVTSDGSGDPRKRVLDAAHAVTSARAAVVEAEAHLAEYEQTLKRLQSVAPGTIPQKAIFEAEQALARSRAALLKMRVELEIKESQLEEARESLATQIKFQELDLADAKLRLQHADDEWSRAESLYKKGAMTASQLQEAQLAQRLAASQLERARMLLELYRKAIPGKEAPADKDQSNAELQFKDVWMTDFDAAQELAIKLHRPLVVFFWGRRGKPGQTLKADVLSNPAVLSNPLLANPDLLRVVAMHFVAVIVDVDIDKKTLALFEFGDVDKKVKQFNVDLVPSVVVLSWIGETRRVLARRDEEIGTAEILIDLLKKLIPEARIDAAAEGSAADNPRQSAEVKPDAPRASGRDPLSDDKPIEATQKAGDQSIGKQEE
jgi:hypothetical protein